MKVFRIWEIKNCTYDGLIKSVAMLKNITTLNIDSTIISDTIFEKFVECMSENLLELKILSLFQIGNSIKSKSIELICKLKNL